MRKHAIGCVYAIGMCILLSLLTFNNICVTRPSVQFKHNQDDAEAKQERCASPKDCPSNSIAIYIRSGLANAIGPEICINGELIMSGTKINVGIGLNTVLLNGSSGGIISSGFYTGADKMLEFLRGIGPGQILLVASYDDPSIIGVDVCTSHPMGQVQDNKSKSRLKEESRELLRRLGSSAAQTLGARDGWVFAGHKAAEGSAFEKHISSDEKTNTFDKWPAVIEISGCFKKT